MIRIIIEFFSLTTCILYLMLNCRSDSYLKFSLHLSFSSSLDLDLNSPAAGILYLTWNCGFVEMWSWYFLDKIHHLLLLLHYSMFIQFPLAALASNSSLIDLSVATCFFCTFLPLALTLPLLAHPRGLRSVHLLYCF